MNTMQITLSSLRPMLVIGGVLVLAVCGGTTTTRATPIDTSTALPAEWKLVWSDEFDGPAGAPPDAAKWVPETGGGGWGNQERQYYTTLANNVSLDGGGHLVITARAEPANSTL